MFTAMLYLACLLLLAPYLVRSTPTPLPTTAPSKSPTRIGAFYKDRIDIITTDASVPARASVGYACNFVGNGTFFVAGNYYSQGEPAVYVYKANENNSYSLDGGLRIKTALVGGDFGAYGLAMDANAEFVLVGMSAYATNKGVVAVFTRNSSNPEWVESLLAPETNVDSNAQFGYAIALSPNAEWAAITAPFDGTAQGSVLIYSRNGLEWSFSQKFTALTHSSVYGASVAFDDSSKILVVGSLGFGGSISIYERLSVAHLFVPIQETLQGIPIYSDARMSTSLDVSATGRTIAVGALYDDPAYTGSVFVFEYNTTSGLYFQQAKLVGPDPGALLGQSVALSGDGNILATGIGRLYGGVVIFLRSPQTGVWTQDTRIAQNIPLESSYFGLSLSLNPLGSKLIIAAPIALLYNGTITLYTTEITSAPSAAPSFAPTPLTPTSLPSLTPTSMPSRLPTFWPTTFAPTTLTPTTVASLFIEFGGTFTDSTVPGIKQGVNCAMTGNGTYFVAGSSASTTPGIFLYKFNSSSGFYAREGSIINSPTFSSFQSYFGSQVDISDDGETIVSGAIGANSFQGRTSVLTKSTDGSNTWSEYVIDPLSNVVSNARFGSSVVISSDSQWIAVGASDDGVNTGSILIYARNTSVIPNSWYMTQKLTGHGVANSNLAAIGLAWDNTATVLVSSAWGTQGYAAVYRRANSSIPFVLTQATLPVDPPIYDGVLGHEADISPDGLTIAVGALYDTNGPGRSQYSGSLYVYDLNSSTGLFETKQKLFDLTLIYDSFFGATVTLATSNLLAVGAMGHDTRTGAMYIYYRTAFGQNFVLDGARRVGGFGMNARFGGSFAFNSDGSTLVVGSFESFSNNGAVSIYKTPMPPSTSPTRFPTRTPSLLPTALPSTSPSASPSLAPSVAPTANPTATPTLNPTHSHTATPTLNPTHSPTATPTLNPTHSPTATPSLNPTSLPTNLPSFTLTLMPSRAPTPPTNSPSTFAPTTLSPTSSAALLLEFGGTFTDNTLPVSGIKQGASCAMVSNGAYFVAGSSGSSTSISPGMFLYKRNQTSGMYAREGLVIKSAFFSSSQSFFGNQLDISDDGETIVAGASAAASSKGQVSVFTKNGTSWSEFVVDPLTNVDSNAGFGSSVVVSSNAQWLAVGAYADGPSVGSILIYARNTSTIPNSWDLTQKIVGRGAANSNLATLGLAWDDSATVLIATSPDLGGFTAIYGRANYTTPFVLTQAALPVTPPVYDGSIGYEADMSPDGLTVAVGALYDTLGDGRSQYSGSVYVYDLDAPSRLFVSRQKLFDTTLLYDSFFGSAIALANCRILAVGAMGHDTRTGAVYIYSRASVGQNFVLDGSRRVGTFSINARFGSCLTLNSAGTTLVVGSFESFGNNGSVSVYNTPMPPSAAPTRVPTLNPTRSPTQAPSQSPTGTTPLLQLAQWSDDLTRIFVDFDSRTNVQNRAAMSDSLICTSYIILQGDSGCSATRCDVFCSWMNSTRLVVDVSPRSNLFLTNTTLTLAESGLIKSRFGGSNAIGAIAVQHPSDPVGPTDLRISSASLIPLCGGNATKFFVSSTVISGLGGRAATFAWYADDVVIPGAINSVLVPSKPLLPLTISYYVVVTNWAGVSTPSNPFNITYTSTALATITSWAPLVFTSPADGFIDLSVSVSLPSDCVPSNATVLDEGYVFNWTILRNSDGARFNASALHSLGGGSPRHRLRISPASLLTPNATYSISLDLDTNIAGIKGSIAFQATVTTKPLVAQLFAPSSLLRAEAITLTAAQSCDPNVASPVCSSTRGAIFPSPWLEYAWSCKDASDDACAIPCLSTALCTIPPSTLAFVSSPYTITVSISSSASPTVSSESISVKIRVLPDPAPSCRIPLLALRPHANRINVAQSGEIAFVGLSDDFSSASAAATLTWKRVLSETTPLVDVNQNSFNLVIPLASLTAEVKYTYRLAVSVVGCSQRFTDVTFTANGPPKGGSLTVTPLTGIAALDDFTMTLNSFEDSDNVDLPILLSLEARFTFTKTDLSEFSTFTAFLSTKVITTKLPLSPRIAFLARARDALGATTLRDRASPFVDFVSTTALVIVNNEVPFNVSSSLSSLVESGGSDDDVLRLTMSLSSSSRTSATSGTSDVITDWARSTQSDLLDVVSSKVTRGTNDPSVVLLQASTLAAVLQGASELQDANTPAGKDFLRRSTALIKALVKNVKNAVTTNGEGDVSKLSELVPQGIGAVTLNAIQSILDVIRTSTFNRRARALQSSTASNTSAVVINDVRQSLKELMSVLLLGSVSGSIPITVPGAEMRMVMARETPSRLGVELISLEIPPFDDLDNSTVIYLPRNILINIPGAESLEFIDLLAVRFRFNVRELVSNGMFPNYTLDEGAPINAVEEVLALDFFENSTSQYHPLNLTEPISLRLPLKFADLPTVAGVGLGCGFWDTLLDKWSSSGCNVTSYRLPLDVNDTTGYLICSCTHASDYSAWQSFVRDIQVFRAVDVTTLTTIAALIVGLLLPSIGMLWVVWSRFGRKRDFSDKRLVHLGAFVGLTRKKIILHQRQRRFFKILKDGKSGLCNASEIDLGKLSTKGNRLHGGIRDLNKEKTEDTIKMEDDALYILRTASRLAHFNAWFSLVIAGLFISSVVLPNAWLNSMSLWDYSLNNPRAVTWLALILTSFALYFIIGLCGLITIWVVDFEYGKQIPQRNWRMSWIFWLNTMALPLALTTFAVPIKEGVSAAESTGLSLAVAGGSLAIFVWPLSWTAWFFARFPTSCRDMLSELMANAQRGLIYQQSVLSIFSKFDPYFDREKRVSVVVAIVLGNLFACAFFISLRVASDVTFAFVVSVVLISAIIVAIPVKFAIRLLFRVSASRTGSSMERVAQIFRIVGFSNDDINPAYANIAEKLDVELLQAFKNLYVQKHRMHLLVTAKAAKEKMDDDESRLRQGLDPAGTYESFLRPLLYSGVVSSAAACALFAISLVNLDKRNDSQGLVVVSLGISFTIILVHLGMLYKGKRMNMYPMFYFLIMAHFLSATVGLAAAGAASIELASKSSAEIALVCAAAALVTLSFVMYLVVVYVYFFKRPHILGISVFLRPGVYKDEQVGGETLALVPLGGGAVQERTRSRKFQVNASQVRTIEGHEFLKTAFEFTDGTVTEEMIRKQKQNVDIARGELKHATNLSTEAWHQMDYGAKLSVKQKQIRLERSVMMKFALVLSEDTSPRPKPIKQIISEKFIYLAWVVVFLYYIGTITYVTFFVFTRESQVRTMLVQNGNPNPSRQQLDANVNAILLLWLGFSFFAIFIGFVVAEPIFVLLRYAIGPMLLRISHDGQRLEDIYNDKKQRDDLEEELNGKRTWLEWITRKPRLTPEEIDAKKRKTRAALENTKVSNGAKPHDTTARGFDVLADVVQALT